MLQKSASSPEGYGCTVMTAVALTQLLPSPPELLANLSPHHSSTQTQASLPLARLSNSNTKLSLPRFSSNHHHHDPTVSSTSSIARHCRNGMLSEAAEEFFRMRLAGIDPNHVTFVTLLSACAHFPSSSALHFGASIHGYVYKLGYDGTNVMLCTALVDMYSKCGCLDIACNVFDGMSVRNSLSWNTMIDGCMRNGDVETAIYLFNEMPKRDKVSWTALISGFVKRGLFEEALEFFQEMQISGVEPDYVTIIVVLAACANLGMLGLGMWCHRYVLLHEDINKNIRVQNSLIDMYSRCGCVEFAREAFDIMKNRSLVSWNSIIVGFAINGYAQEALEHFYKMQEEGYLKPDAVTFTGALTACSHAGLVKKGLELYKTMTKVYKISPRIEHYGCMVDLLSRAGRLEDALHFIKTMKMKPNEVVLGSLLAACRTHGNVNLAEKLRDYVVELQPDCDFNHVLLSNIYARAGRWDDVGRTRKRMKDLGIKKTPGLSSIEIDCSIHDFVCGDKSHARSDHIYEMLEHLSIQLSLHGY